MEYLRCSAAKRWDVVKLTVVLTRVYVMNYLYQGGMWSASFGTADTKESGELSSTLSFHTHVKQLK